MSASENPSESKLEAVIQRLEESVLSEEKRLTVRGSSPDEPAASLPARVREIVSRNLSDSAGGMSSGLSLQEENRVLQTELSRVEDLLAHSRAERDELAIKYSAISERLEQALRLETGEEGRDSPESRSLAQQNVDLRRRLDEEQAAYKRKLTAYQEGQQRQAQLVQKLQAKVLQYKKKCADLEQTLLEKSTGQCDGSSNGHRRDEDEPSSELESALIRLEEEQQRSSGLSAVNAMLREQLEQAGLANEALSQDIRRLTADWTKAREELEQRESDWRREEESFHSYFSSEHSRLLALWRQVVGFRRHVCELKSATERDLCEVRNELASVAQSVQLQCVRVCADLRSREDGSTLLLERETAQRLQLEQQLRETVTEMMTLQAKSDSERAELNKRLTDAVRELERLKARVEDREQEVTTLNRKLQDQRTHTHMPLVFSDSGGVDGNTEESLLPLLRSSSSSAIIPDSCLSALRSALTSRQIQLQELRERLQSAQSSVQQLRRQQGEAESGRREAELRAQTLQGERDEAQRERETAVRERDRLRQERDTLSSEKDAADKAAQAAQTQMQVLQLECDRLQLAITSAQREREHEREERDAAALERDRVRSETDRLQQLWEESERRASSLRAELAAR
ncbi:rootletin-like [Sinocyclocheilus rhinocerous]|uniref:rootletin-like n=1 Tax=Sinocyclocheilus rhinocerous TaxID=307959 RepID=UPI0007B83B3F|nr:PREDICTED: rootletin-like [Sinocyclocheilus rhinocerous]